MDEKRLQSFEEFADFEAASIDPDAIDIIRALIAEVRRLQQFSPEVYISDDKPNVFIGATTVK